MKKVHSSRISDLKDLNRIAEAVISDVSDIQDSIEAERAGKEYEPPVWLSRQATAVDDHSPKRRNLSNVIVSSREKVFPQLANEKSIKSLTVVKLNDKLSQLMSQFHQLKVLTLRSGTFTNFRFVEGLKNLRHLIIDENVKLESLDSIEKLKNLLTLSLRGTPRIESIAQVKNFHSLIGLSIEAGLVGGMPRPITLVSLAPLRALKKLKLLRLIGIRVASDDLSPLVQLPSGITLDISTGYFKLEQLARIAAAYPELKEEWSRPLGHSGTCRRCNSTKMFFAGENSPSFCMRCDQAKIQEYVGRFLCMVSAYSRN